MSNDAYIILHRLMEKVSEAAPELTEKQRVVVSNAIIQAMEFGRTEIAGKVISTLMENTTAGYEFD